MERSASESEGDPAQVPWPLASDIEQSCSRRLSAARGPSIIRRMAGGACSEGAVSHRMLSPSCSPEGGQHRMFRQPLKDIVVSSQWAKRYETIDALPGVVCHRLGQDSDRLCCAIAQARTDFARYCRDIEEMTEEETRQESFSEEDNRRSQAPAGRFPCKKIAEKGVRRLGSHAREATVSLK
jgi:hypothetical protein